MDVAGIKFTETMSGYISREALDDYQNAFEMGKNNDSKLSFTVSVVSQDIKTMLSDEKHQASLSGSVVAPSLSAEPLVISEGTFNLFVRDPDTVNSRKMLYQMKLIGKTGDIYYLEGFKQVHDDPGFDIWEDTTTLFTTIYQSLKTSENIIAKGIVKISPADFAKQLTTFEISDANSKMDQLSYAAEFGKFFAGELYDVYGGVATGLDYFSTGQLPREKRKLNAPEPVVYRVRTEDDFIIQLTRYQAGDKGPVVLTHGLGVSSKIFSMDTYEVNLLEYLCENNYDVWLLDYRVSIDLPCSNKQSTGDDVAKYDYPAAVNKVLEITGQSSVQMVVHCYGATTWTMATLGGHLTGVRSVVVSQISAHVETPLLTKIKAGLRVPKFLAAIGIDSMTAYVDKASNWRQKLMDNFLKLYPIQREEQCKNPVCRRVTFLYGQLYEHDQLNDKTHEYLHEMYGIANISTLMHLARMVREKQIISADGKDVYLKNLDRMKMPIAFIVGEENQCFLPQSIEKTFSALVKNNGESYYKKHVIPKYGHIDCIHGKNASKDVYPYILDHLEAT